MAKKQREVKGLAFTFWSTSYGEPEREIYDGP